MKNIAPVLDTAGTERFQATVDSPATGETNLVDAGGTVRVQIARGETGLGPTEFFDSRGFNRLTLTCEGDEVGVTQVNNPREQGVLVADELSTKLADADGVVVTTLKLGVSIQKTHLVSRLPAASEVGAGAKAFVIDASNFSVLETVAGGGNFSVPVYCDGTCWRIG